MARLTHKKRWQHVKDFLALCAFTMMEPGMDFSFKVTKPVPSTDKRYIGKIGPKTRITLRIFPSPKR